MEQNEIQISRVRAVERRDTERLNFLYAQLDTCNGSQDKVQRVIEESRTAHKEFKTFVLVGEKINPETNDPGPVVGSGSLIRLSKEDQGVQMYRENQGGWDLVERKVDAVEFGAMIVDKDARGGGVGKAITVMRALIARKMSGIIGVSEILTEFLPPYSDTGDNAFWTDMILQSLKKNGSIDAVKKECSDILNIPVATDMDLFVALCKKLTNQDRNRIVSQYFRQHFDSDEITPDARAVTGNVGKGTINAKINLEQVFSGGLQPVGYFPIDGGANYSADIDMGALGNRIVKVEIAKDNTTDREIMRASDDKAIVMLPIAGTSSELKSLIAYSTPGIFAPHVAKLPHQIAELMHVFDGDEVMVRKILRTPRSR